MREGNASLDFQHSILIAVTIKVILTSTLYDCNENTSLEKKLLKNTINDL